MSVLKCRSCKSSKKQIVFGKNVYGGLKNQHFYKCSTCQIVYLYPTINKIDETKFYKNNFEKYMNERSKNEIKWDNPYKHFISNKKEYFRRKKFLNKKLIINKKILEVGSSSGFMLKPLMKKRNKLYGIEPSEVFRNYTNNLGINTYKNLKEAIKLHENSLDLVIHYYVLEHIEKPIEFLDKLMLLLKKNGKMIFEVPNINDPLITFLKTTKFDNFYWSFVHHWYFSSLTLSNLLKKNNYKFKLYFDQRYDLSNHLIWLKDGIPGGSKRFSKIFSESLIKKYKNDLIKSGYCDTLGVIITK